MTLGVKLMCEMSRRGGNTEPLLRDAGQQYGYALDAPEEIPAGGVEWYSDSLLPEIAGPLEVMVPREQP